MDAKARALTLHQTRRTSLLPWVIVAAEALLIVALAIALLVTQLGGGVSPTRAGSERASSSTQVPHDLAAAGYATSGVITGTGPGLAVYAARPAPAVTGTGPGLVQIAGQR